MRRIKFGKIRDIRLFVPFVIYLLLHMPEAATDCILDLIIAETKKGFIHGD